MIERVGRWGEETSVSKLSTSDQNPTSKSAHVNNLRIAGRVKLTFRDLGATVVGKIPFQRTVSSFNDTDEKHLTISIAQRLGPPNVSSNGTECTSRGVIGNECGSCEVREMVLDEVGEEH